jgi:hypothetical protein
VDEQGVLADPAQPGALRQVALEDGAGVGVGFPADGVGELPLNKFGQLGQAEGDEIMVV